MRTKRLNARGALLTHAHADAWRMWGIGVLEVTVNFVQQRLLGDAPQLFCLEYCLLFPLKTNGAFRTSRFLVCAVFFSLWRNSPQWARASSFTTFLDHTQGRTTVGKTHLDEWSARGRDFYLTTHNTYDRRTAMALVEFEHAIWADERPQTYVLNRASSGTGLISC